MSLVGKPKLRRTPGEGPKRGSKGPIGRPPHGAEGSKGDRRGGPGTGRGALRVQRFGAWYESSDTARDRQSRANRVRGPEELGRLRSLGYLGLRRVRGSVPPCRPVGRSPVGQWWVVPPRGATVSIGHGSSPAPSGTGHLLLGVLDPADELVAGQRRDVLPGIECRGVAIKSKDLSPGMTAVGPPGTKHGGTRRHEAQLLTTPAAAWPKSAAPRSRERSLAGHERIRRSVTRSSTVTLAGRSSQTFISDDSTATISDSSKKPSMTRYPFSSQSRRCCADCAMLSEPDDTIRYHPSGRKRQFRPYHHHVRPARLRRSGRGERLSLSTRRDSAS
jgi:hypothetical protein